MKKYYFNSNLKFSVTDESINENLLPNQLRINMKNCGICGSDIHYFLHGENGGRKIKEPLMLGHETVGEIIEVGKEVSKFKIDDRIAVNPALYCYNCKYCKTKNFNLCENVLFLGSAAKTPHTQGAFREQLIIDQSQCHIINDSVTYEEAAFAEPFAVALHASSFTEYNDNQKIVIAGCGPIGLLLLKILVQKVEQEQIFVLDVNNNVLDTAKKIGNINTINIKDNLNFINDYRNFFDIAFEASGNVNSINNLIEICRRGANIIQIGNMPGGLIKINYNKVMIKELKLQGSYRFINEFDDAVNKINNKEYIFSDMLTHKFKLQDCEEAMKIASDKNKSIKVQVYN
jgi:L-idonate 5-dehydrogenase